MEVENQIRGTIKCPDCGAGTFVLKKGCNVQSCKKHRPKFHYFCVQCYEPTQKEYAACKSPKRNHREACVLAQKQRNLHTSLNPIFVDSDGEEKFWSNYVSFTSEDQDVIIDKEEELIDLRTRMPHELLVLSTSRNSPGG